MDAQGQINARFTVRRQMSSWKQFAILATFKIVGEASIYLWLAWFTLHQ